MSHFNFSSRQHRTPAVASVQANTPRTPLICFSEFVLASALTLLVCFLSSIWFAANSHPKGLLLSARFATLFTFLGAERVGAGFWGQPGWQIIGEVCKKFEYIPRRLGHGSPQRAAP